MKKIKDFKDVNIGDIGFENPDAGGVWDNPEGPIIWKGTLKELQNSKYNCMLEDDEEDIDEIPEDYNWVIIKHEMWGDILFNYNCDPSGTVVFI